MGKINRIKREIIGILIISLSVFVFLSLITHNPWDPSLFTNNATKTDVKNLLGIFGSYLSDTLLQSLGLTAYLVPIIFLVYGIRKIFGKERERRLAITISAVIVLILSVSSVFTLIFKESSGGIIGFLITKGSIKLLSVTGSYLLFIPLIVVTLMFLIQFSIIDLIRGTGKTTLSIPLKVKDIAQPQIRLEESTLQTSSYKQEPLPFAHMMEQKPDERHPVIQKTKGDYELPSIDFLKDPQPLKARPTKEDLLESSSLLEKKLQDFSIDGKVTHVSPGPVVTMFEFEPAPGIKINKIVSLSDDLSLALKTTSLRISPIPGRSTIGIEVPNKEREDVFLKEILSSDTFKKNPSRLILALGKDIFGTPVVADLNRMPHLLIAGSTGSGKSVCLNTLILSLLYRAAPREVKMIMIDPKMLELTIYDSIPHLMLPIITSPKDASDALKKTVYEMERRYRILAEAGSRNIEGYNKKIKSSHGDDKEPLPYLIIFIDELADLMLVSAHEVENSIARLAQMARAAGIHLVLATQRPSVDVLTGVIKANFSSRISFRVASKLDSRIVLDTYGAEQLLGKGDMLFVSPGNRTTRVHGAYVSEEEIKTIVNFIKTQGEPDYTTFDTLAAEEPKESGSEDRDELYQLAKDLVLSTGQASISYIQRKLKIGYNRAARIIEMMEEEGLIGPPGEAGKPREVLRRRK